MARKRHREHDSETSMPQQKKRAPNTSANQSAAQSHEYQLPDLPPIPDPAIAKAASTHQGTLPSGTPLIDSYDRLEFLGDSYLAYLAASTVNARYPNFDSGKLSQTKQLIVCNATLAGYASQYKLDKRASLPAEIQEAEHSKHNSKLWIKTLGDLFEAYVGGILEADPYHGYATIDAWMVELWEPLFSTKVEAKVVNRNAKQELSTKIMTKGTGISYSDDGPVQKSSLKGRDIYSVKVCYTGLGYQDLWLGAGKGPNKAEAGYAAASQALQHPKLTEIMAKKKERDLISKAQKDLLEKDPQSDLTEA
ncbi:MAG: hypothetical protein Q9209_001390 [Squamulea sp. 1 TL-2023]